MITAQVSCRGMPFYLLSISCGLMSDQSHAIELGGVRSEHRKKNRILFQDKVMGGDFNDTLSSLDTSLE